MNSFWSGFSRYHGRYSRWRTRLRRPCSGVMPKMLDEREITSQKVSELILVDSMHERKEK